MSNIPKTKGDHLGRPLGQHEKRVLSVQCELFDDNEAAYSLSITKITVFYVINKQIYR
jgi:hypothetical protein